MDTGDYVVVFSFLGFLAFLAFLAVSKQQPPAATYVQVPSSLRGG